MNLRYQHGHLRCVERKNGPPRWEFLWRDSTPSGQRIRRNVVMVLLDVTTGLRRSELFALKWGDVDFSHLTIDINRSIFQGVIGNCKTEASRRPVPLSLDVAADLWLWKERTI